MVNVSNSEYSSIYLAVRMELRIYILAHTHTHTVSDWWHVSYVVPVLVGGPAGYWWAGEVCCRTLTQHTSTNCDSALSTGFSHQLLLNKCWRSTLLLMSLCWPASALIWTVVLYPTSAHNHQTLFYTYHIHHCLLSLSVFLCFIVGDFHLLWQNQSQVPIMYQTVKRAGEGHTLSLLSHMQKKTAMRWDLILANLHSNPPYICRQLLKK